MGGELLMALPGDALESSRGLPSPVEERLVVLLSLSSLAVGFLLLLFSAHEGATVF